MSENLNDTARGHEVFTKEAHVGDNLVANGPNFSVTKEQREREAKYRAALRFAEAGFPVVPLVRKDQYGKNFPQWVLAVPAQTPGSTDPAQLKAWFLSNPDWEIAIAPAGGIGHLLSGRPKR
jgi:hypothetical protein